MNESELLKKGLALPLMEAFYSIQGEGFHTGKAAFFARIGGCDVGCSWCDVKESWDASLWPLTLTEDIIAMARQNPARSVVVTGGEPLIYNLDFFCNELRKEGFDIFLETSGSREMSGIWDWICVSPKKYSPPLPEILARADELKVIVKDRSDFAWAEKNAGMMKKGCLLFLQPEWSARNIIMTEIVDYVKNHPSWMISLQTHKYMRIP